MSTAFSTCSAVVHVLLLLYRGKELVTPAPQCPFTLYIISKTLRHAICDIAYPPCKPQPEVQLAPEEDWGKDDEASIKLPADAELFEVDIVEDLRPTQLSVGLQQVGTLLPWLSQVGSRTVAHRS